VKKIFILILCVTICSIEVFGRLLIPNGVFDSKDIDQARRKAKEDNIPIAFLWADSKTPSPEANEVSESVINFFRKKTIFVFVDADDSEAWKHLPKKIKDAFNSKESGTYIPKTVLADPGITKIIAIIPYKDDAINRSALFRHAENEISKFPKTFKPKSVKCLRETDVFDAKDPSKLLGKFAPGTAVTIQSEKDYSGKRLVLYKQPDGTDLSVLCHPGDLSE